LPTCFSSMSIVILLCTTACTRAHYYVIAGEAKQSVPLFIRHCGEPKLRAEGVAGSEAILCVTAGTPDCRVACGSSQ